MKTSKSKIAKDTIVVKSASSLTKLSGQYKVKVNGVFYENDLSGHLYKSVTGQYYNQWIDTGLMAENKNQFVNYVFEDVTDKN